MIKFLLFQAGYSATGSIEFFCSNTEVWPFFYSWQPIRKCAPARESCQKIARYLTRAHLSERLSCRLHFACQEVTVVQSHIFRSVTERWAGSHQARVKVPREALVRLKQSEDTGTFCAFPSLWALTGEKEQKNPKSYYCLRNAAQHLCEKARRISLSITQLSELW